MAKPNRNWLMYEHAGQQRPLTEIARMVGIRPGTLNMRIKRGMSIEQALAAPVQKRIRKNY